MKAIAIEKFGGREVLQLMDLPQPEVGPKEVLVRLKAAGVNPADWKVREGLFQGRLSHRFPIIIGWDGAGVVERVGSEVSEYQKDDAVMAYARKDILHDGTYAEYISLETNHLAPKPSNLSFEEAAVIPLSALTAYQSLYESLQLKPGEVILIHAGGGGVGSYAIPMAKKIGAHVITTASKAKHPHVKRLGADHVIDYREKDFVEEIKKSHPKGIDAVFDTVGAEIQLKSSQVLKPEGRLTSILALQKNFFSDKGLKADYVFVRPHSGQLKQIKEMVEGGELRPHVSTCFNLRDAAKAHELIEAGHLEGKIALSLNGSGG